MPFCPVAFSFCACLLFVTGFCHPLCFYTLSYHVTVSFVVGCLSGVSSLLRRPLFWLGALWFSLFFIWSVYFCLCLLSVKEYFCCVELVYGCHRWKNFIQQRRVGSGLVFYIFNVYLLTPFVASYDCKIIQWIAANYVSLFVWFRFHSQ